MAMDLVNEMAMKLQELTQSIRLLRDHGTKFAQAEHDYKVALSQEVYRLKDEKMPATLINITVYGHANIARLRMQRDIAEVMYNANQEHINVTKLQIRIIENQIQREYGQNGQGG